MNIHTLLVTHPWFSAGLLSILTGILLLAGRANPPRYTHQPPGNPLAHITHQQEKTTPPVAGPGSLTYKSFGAVFLVAGLVLIIVQFIS
jgi:hypothetical protein